MKTTKLIEDENRWEHENEYNNFNNNRKYGTVRVYI